MTLKVLIGGGGGGGETLNNQPGPSCSRLTMSLVNISLKLWSLSMAYMLFFAEKM